MIQSLCFKVTSSDDFASDLDGFTDNYGYLRLTNTLSPRLPSVAFQDKLRFDFDYMSVVVSLPAVLAANGTVITPAVTTGPCLNALVSTIDNTQEAIDKFNLLISQISSFFTALPIITLTPDPLVQTAFGAVPKAYHKTPLNTILLQPVAVPKRVWS